MPEFLMKKVSMSQVAAWMLAALMTGAAGGGIAAPDMSSVVNQNTTAIAKNTAEIKEIRELIRQLELSGARVEEQFAGLKAGQDRIEKKLERLR